MACQCVSPCQCDWHMILPRVCSESCVLQFVSSNCLLSKILLRNLNMNKALERAQENLMAAPLQVEASKDFKRRDGFKSVVDWVWLCSFISCWNSQAGNQAAWSFQSAQSCWPSCIYLELPGSCIFTTSFMSFCGSLWCWGGQMSRHLLQMYLTELL